MDKKEKNKFKKILKKIQSYTILLFNYMWRSFKYLTIKIWSAIKLLIKGIWYAVKFLWFKRHFLLISLLFIILIIGPYFIIDCLFKKGKLTTTDWGNVIGGCLGYYGTVILGCIAVSQTHKSLKQNEKTFISEKFSYIEVQDSYVISLTQLNKQTLKIIKENSINQYFVYKNIFEIEENKYITFSFPYKYIQSPINEIKLLNIYINDEHYKPYENIKTDIVYHPDNKNYSIDIIFIEKDFTEKFEKLFNEKNLLIKLNLKITSSFNVITTQQICLNLYNEVSINIKHLKTFNSQVKMKFDNISYSYNRRFKNGK